MGSRDRRNPEAGGRPGEKGIELKKGRTLRVSGVLAALGALSVVVAGGPASAQAPRANATVITMEQDGRELFFEAPESVEPGANLKIVNKTDPKEIGPHTFSLVNRKVTPTSDEKRKDCARQAKGICGAIYGWHEVDLQSGQIGRNPVEVGKKGWNQQGDLKRTGDSWVAEKKNQSLSQKVSAPEGKTLHYFCATHPEMEGKIRVEG